MSRTLPTKSLAWADLLRVSEFEIDGETVAFCERLLRAALDSPSMSDFLHDQLPELASELSVSWSAVMERTPEWDVSAEWGRRPPGELPVRFIEDVLDRGAGGCWSADRPAVTAYLAVPVSSETVQAVLVLAGRSVSAEALPRAVLFGRMLGLGLDVVARQQQCELKIDRLRSTLQIASSFARERDSERLLNVIAVEATRLLDCDRASIFLWDREHGQVVACPALGMEGGTLRLPDDAGIVGQVIQTGHTIRVDDAYQDARFNQDVDKATGYRTRNLICVPMLNEDGVRIGAFEGINKNDGAFTAEDEESLMELGVHAATAIHNTQEWEQLIRSRKQLAEQVVQGVRIIGESPAIVALRDTLGRLAGTDLPVLLLGESGTGKEVVAQALHYGGPRVECPFVAVNCAALTETLLESELFGHEQGAFTDARETRKGKFELADGGTLFLDEIGDMSPGGQAKLLRVLEQKVITRVGGTQSIPINVRVIAATNSDLVEAVRSKRFREDLYYRFSVVTQVLPPLRDRPEDILPLAEHFLEQFSRQAGRATLQLSADARRRLQSHSWPGNVRELRNLMERVAFLSAGERVEPNDLAFILSPDAEAGREPSPDAGLAEATRQFQQEHIRRSVKRVQGNMSEAARLLGLHRSNLYRKMRQLDMKEVGGEE